MRTGRGNMSDTRIKRLPINLQTTSKNSSHKKAKIFGECVCVSGCFIGKGVWGGGGGSFSVTQSRKANSHVSVYYSYVIHVVNKTNLLRELTTVNDFKLLFINSLSGDFYRKLPTSIPEVASKVRISAINPSAYLCKVGSCIRSACFAQHFYCISF